MKVVFNEKIKTNTLYYPLDNPWNDTKPHPLLISGLIRKILLAVLILAFNVSRSGLIAQQKSIHPNSNEAVHHKHDTTRAGQTDIRDIIREGLKLKGKPDSTRMKGEGPFFSVIPMVGYSLMSGLTGVLSASTSFYTSQDRNRFSNILFNAYYSQYNQFWTTINSNIFIEKRKLHLYGDWRYYNFPTNTFGLGSASTFADELKVQYYYIRFYQVLYREITENFFAGLGYNLDYHWNIRENPPSGPVYDQIMMLQDNNKSVSSGISFNMQFDTRKNSVNPLSGTLVSLQFRQNLAWLGSDRDWDSFILDIRKFVRLPASSGNVLAFWSYNNLTMAGEPPYFDLPSTGWDNYNNTGRGYVPGRYTGKNLLYGEMEYRMALTRNGLFGCVAFCNAETVFRKFTESGMKILPGAGMGLRIKVNKNSGANLAIDYGFGVDGSKGLFVNLGEVF